MSETLPKWAEQLKSLYVSDAATQFIVSGNICDKLIVNGSLGTLEDFFNKTMLQPFDVVLTYDVGRGIVCSKGKQYFNHDGDNLPSAARPAVEVITEYLIYCANNISLNKLDRKVAVIIKDANLVAPNGQTFNSDINAVASLIRDWGTRTEFNHFATFLFTENVNDLHPLILSNERTARIAVPLPSTDDLKRYLTRVSEIYCKALRLYSDPANLGDPLLGVTLSQVESLLKQRHYADKPLESADVVLLKKQIIEKSGDGLIEFIESDKTLDDIIGQDEAKKMLRAQLALWKKNDLRAIPMGYLLAAPIGVGKTFLVKCLAGEAGVPVVRVKNFRTKWQGDTESKQEKIIRLIRALGRCFVFFDEADQTLGRRDSGEGDGGTSGRVYAAWAEEMSNEDNRGKIVWLLASSRADLIEVDLKRPGRVDVIIPLFPTGTDEESWALLSGMLKRDGFEFPSDALQQLKSVCRIDKGLDLCRNVIPHWLTAGAATALSKRILMEVCTDNRQPMDALIDCLWDYQPPVSLSKLEEQIRIAANNCSDTAFIPEAFKPFRDL